MKWDEIISTLIENKYIYISFTVLAVVVVFFLTVSLSKKFRGFMLEIVEKIKNISFSKSETISMNGEKANNNARNSTILKDSKIIKSEIEAIGENTEISNSEINDSKIGVIGSKKNRG